MHHKSILWLISVTLITYSSTTFGRSHYADFSEPASVGLGSARDGSEFRTSNQSAFSVESGTGVVAINGAGNRVTAALFIKNTRDIEASASFALTNIPQIGFIDAGIVLRQDNDTNSFNGYRAVISFASDRYVLRLTKIVNGQTFRLANQVFTFPALSNEKINLKLSTTKANPTLVRAKVWPFSAIEPDDWILIAEDSEPAIQESGRFATLFFQSTSEYIGTSKVFVDDLLVNRVSVDESQSSTDGSFDATVLESVTTTLRSGFPPSRNSINLENVAGKPTHIVIRPRCRIGSLLESASNVVIFKSVSGQVILELVGCNVRGIDGNPSQNVVDTSSDRIVPIPAGTANIEIVASGNVIRFQQFGPGVSTIVVDVLGSVE